MGSISTMIREMGTSDTFSSVEELTRVLDTTSQMKLFKGVQSAREFRQRFRDTVAGLREIAEDLHTTLEGATQFYDQQRQMGIFGSQAISSSLQRTRGYAGASGMSMEQMQTIGMQGAQFGRAVGIRGRVGAAAMQRIASNIGVGMQIGVLSDEMVSEATGGLTGAEGAQAMAGQIMERNMRFLQRREGRALLAAAWDPESGGINQGMVNRIMSGNVDFNQLLSQGRRNIYGSGRNRSEFFRNEERLRGDLMEAGGGDLSLMVLARHFENRGVDEDNPQLERWLRRRYGASQGEIEAAREMSRNMPQIIAESRARVLQQTENDLNTRTREMSGLSGLQRRLSTAWSRDVEGPLRQLGDDLTTAWTQGVEQIVGDLEGSITTRVGATARQAASDVAAGRANTFNMSGAEFQKYQQRLQQVRAPEMSTVGRMGAAFGLRSGSMADQLIRAGANPDVVAGMSPDQQQRELVRRRSALASSRETAITRAGGQAQFEALTNEVSRLVLSDPARYGAVSATERDLFSGGRAASYATAQRRASRLRESSASFRKATEGMSSEQIIGLMQQYSGGLEGTDAELVTPGGGGLGTRGITNQQAAALRQEASNRLAELAASNDPTRGTFMGGVARAADTATALMTGIPGLAAARMLGQRTLRVSELINNRGSATDFTNLLNEAAESPELFEALQTLATGSGSAKDTARTSLLQLANRRAGQSISGPLGEVNLSADNQRALRSILSGGSPMNEALTAGLDALRGSQSSRARQRYAETETPFLRAIEAHRSAMVDALGASTTENIERIAQRRVRLAESGEGTDAIAAAERTLMQQLVSEGRIGDVANFLAGSDFEGAAYVGGMVSNIERRTAGIRRGRGRGADSARTADMLQEALQGSFRDRGGNAARIRLNRSQIRGIESGQLGTAELVRQLNAQGLRLAEGTGTTDVERALSPLLEVARGGTQLGEAQDRVIREEQGRAEGTRHAGTPARQTSIPQQQLDVLNRLYTLTELTARQAGVKQDVIASAIGRLNTGTNPDAENRPAGVAAPAAGS
jgi:hypothetical protein